MTDITEVFPAPAGINRNLAMNSFNNAGVPRASGDKPVSKATVRRCTQCSPRQRG